MVLARLRSAASRSRCATATKTASRMLSCAMRAAAFSPSSGDPCAVEHSTTSAIVGERRAAVVGDGDRPRALPARQLQRLEDGGRRSRMREADRDVAPARAARPTSASCARRRRRWCGCRCAGTCGRRRGRSAPSRRCRRSRAGARCGCRSAAWSKASGSRIDRVSSSAWIEVRKTFWTISAPLSSGDSS